MRWGWRLHLLKRDGASWEQGRRKAVEQAWPEYSVETFMLETPSYTLDGAVGDPQRSHGTATPSHTSRKTRLQRGKEWLRQYLQQHMQKVQELKQHRVHVWHPHLTKEG